MRNLQQRSIRLVRVALVLFLASTAPGGTVILKRAFVTQHQNRATIAASFIVDHAHKRPNAAAKDGDMHVAGRAPKEVGLPMVAEVVNAVQSTQQAAIKRIHAVEGKGSTVPISGAWRFWFEHPADSQTQFADVQPAANTNPDHSFEIHPITQFDGNDISKSFQAIPGFQPYAASKAFASYESMTVTVSANASAISLTSKKSGYNYAQFRIRLKGSPKKLDDGGYAALADVFDIGKDNETSVAEDVRMIFVPNTPPLLQLVKGKLGDGDELNVIGIPRVNLNAIMTFVNASSGHSATRKLPYEMIVVGVTK